VSVSTVVVLAALAYTQMQRTVVPFRARSPAHAAEQKSADMHTWKDLPEGFVGYDRVRRLPHKLFRVCCVSWSVLAVSVH
jgi:hypothetical protein